MEVKARNAIVAILNAIMNKNAESLKASEYTQDLINKVNNRITTLNANNEKEIFNNIKFTVAESQATRTEARRQRQGLKFLSSMNMQRCRKKGGQRKACTYADSLQRNARLQAGSARTDDKHCIFKQLPQLRRSH